MMKLLSVLIFLIMFPLAVSAHGGVEKRASTGDITVYLIQTPLSPLIGEEVKMTFVIQKDNGERPKNLDVKLVLIDTFFNDATRDKIILTENKKTDVNGSFEFIYTFNKENYFDVDLKFKHPTTSEEIDLGFLVQPRYSASLKSIYIANGLIVGFLIIIIYRLTYGTRPTQKSS